MTITTTHFEVTPNEVTEIAAAAGFDETEFFGSAELRWYQIAARNEAIAAVAAGIKRILIVLPTGTGKTITIACSLSDPAMRAALNVPSSRKIRVLFIAHKNRLLTQAERAFVDSSEVEVIMQSAFSELSVHDWDIAVIDEAHHESMASIQMKLDRVGQKPLIGLTATPDRADGMVIKFEKIINPISREEAVTQGYLTPTMLYSIVDVPSKDKIALLTDVFENFAHLMGQTMLFVRSKREVAALSHVLTNLGYESCPILDQTDTQLNRVLDGFANREYQFLVNCNRISEGVDVAGCDTVVLGRQVGSYPLLNQIIGRASRPDTDFAHVWELINPLSGRNLDTTCVVGTPESHKLFSKERGSWKTREFDYTSHHIAAGVGFNVGAPEWNM